MKNVVIWILLLEAVWGLNIVDYRIVHLLAVAPLFFFFARFRVDRRCCYEKIRLADRFIILVFVCLFTNSISCWINRGQNLLLTFSTLDYRNFLSLFFFYYLYYKNFPIHRIEKAIEILFFFYCACFLLQYFIFYPYPVFHLLSLSLNEHRFRLVGQLVNFIGYFYFLNCFLLGRKRKMAFLGCLLGFLCIFLLGFRSFVVATIVVSLVLIWRVKGLSRTSLCVVFGLGLVLIISTQFEVSQKVLSNMITRQMDQQKREDDYIRIREWRYFTEYHFLSAQERFFGSGPENEKSAYGKKMAGFRTDGGSSIATWWDWGLIGLSWSMGVPLAILLYVFVLYMIFFKTEKRYFYISTTYLLLLLTSVSTIEIYRFGAFAFHSIAIYLVCKISEERSVAHENRNNNSSAIF